MAAEVFVMTLPSFIWSFLIFYGGESQSHGDSQPPFIYSETLLVHYVFITACHQIVLAVHFLHVKEHCTF